MTKHPTAHSTAPASARKLLALLPALMAQAALTLFCHNAMAADVDADVDAEPWPAATTVAAQLVAQIQRETVARTIGTQRAPLRQGMHIVLRLAVVDVVSHPDSGDLELSPRSQLLNRSIARKPLAVGVTWRF